MNSISSEPIGALQNSKSDWQEAIAISGSFTSPIKLTWVPGLRITFRTSFALSVPSGTERF